MEKISLVECPRDAMQGLHDFIETADKIRYLNALLKCNFDVLDFGSFVSPKAIPQMRDTQEVLDGLDLNGVSTKLLAIIANERGAQSALMNEQIAILGFPLSISETFQQRNTNASITEAWKMLDGISNLCNQKNKQLVVYLSMGFGNPYGDVWNEEIVSDFSYRLHHQLGVNTIALSDTIGCATPSLVSNLFSNILKEQNTVEFGAHLHVLPHHADAIIQAAYEGGCRRFDGAIKGFGGCPMAKDDLTGNMPTEKLLEWFLKENISTDVNRIAFNAAYEMSTSIFNS
jgi:hydroxymethylglutaryl-CoA lyase